MYSTLKRIFIGPPIASSEEHHQRLTKKIALAVFASDAISSTAYATEEILLVLVAAGGYAAFADLVPISIIVVILLTIVVISYRQTLYAYPSGGGSYIVSRENLGRTPVARGRLVAARRLHPHRGGERVGRHRRHHVGVPVAPVVPGRDLRRLRHPDDAWPTCAG